MFRDMASCRWLPSAKGFGHQDIVSRSLDRNFGSEWRGASLDVAVMFVEGRQRHALADDAEIDGTASRFAKIAFCSFHQLAAQARALARRLNAEQTEKAAVAAPLDVNATREIAGVFRDEKFPFSHIAANAFGVDAVAFDERQFHLKSRIDEPDKIVRV